jgi:hypothetical protein
MVRDALTDPVAGLVEELAPQALRKRITPGEAAEALVRGIEKRAARTIRPRRWSLLFWLRGILGPALDERWGREQQLRGAVLTAEGRGEA